MQRTGLAVAGTTLATRIVLLAIANPLLAIVVDMIGAMLIIAHGTACRSRPSPGPTRWK